MARVKAVARRYPTPAERTRVIFQKRAFVPRTNARKSGRLSYTVSSYRGQFVPRPRKLKKVYRRRLSRRPVSRLRAR